MPPVRVWVAVGAIVLGSLGYPLGYWLAEITR